MAFVTVKAVVLAQLSVLLVSCLTTVSCDEVDRLQSVAQSPHPHAPAPISLPPAEPPKHPKSHPPGHHHHHHHQKIHQPVRPPSQSPVHPPSHPPPVHPPSHPPPVHPPSHPPKPSYPPLPMRKFIAVEGVVCCKPCYYCGVDTLLGAKPLPGAVVKLACNNSKWPLEEEGKTDKNGYFLIEPKKITTYASHKCKAFLVSSPMANCSKPTDLNFGQKGASLMMPHNPKPPAPPQHPLPYVLFEVGPFAFEPSVKCPHH